MGPVGRGWGVRVGHLGGTGTPGPMPRPTQSCPEQHKAGFSGKRVKNIPPGGAEPAPSRSGLWSPTPHAEVSVTWRVWGIDGGTLAGSQGAARTSFLSKNSLAARQLGRASWGPQLAAPNESWGKGGDAEAKGRPRQQPEEAARERTFPATHRIQPLPGTGRRSTWSRPHAPPWRPPPTGRRRGHTKGQCLWGPVNSIQ